MISSSTPYLYSGSASAGVNVLLFAIDASTDTTANADKSTNFLKINVIYQDSTNNKIAEAEIYLQVNIVNNALYDILPKGASSDYEFPVVNSGDYVKYADLKMPDLADYYNYFKIFITYESGGKIGVNLRCPNVNGTILAKVRHNIFE